MLTTTLPSSVLLLFIVIITLVLLLYSFLSSLRSLKLFLCLFPVIFLFLVTSIFGLILPMIIILLNLNPCSTLTVCFHPLVQLPTSQAILWIWSCSPLLFFPPIPLPLILLSSLPSLNFLITAYSSLTSLSLLYLLLLRSFVVAIIASIHLCSPLSVPNYFLYQLFTHFLPIY